VVLVVVGVYVVHWLGLIPGFSESVSDNIEKGTTFLSSSTNGTSSDHANAMSDNAVSTSPSSSYEAASSNRVTNDAITAPITATAIIPTPAPTNTPANAPTTASTPTKISADPTVPAPASINIPAKAPTVIPAPTNTAAAPKPAAPAIAPTPPVTLASPSPVAKAITPANQDNPSATNKNMLIIKVREDSWVEIKDANDRTLISRLMAAGTTETLSVAKPVFLTVGNAAGVDVTLRGKSVDLKSSAKSNVARLNLK
ncbi:MAG: RodZ domain-containing protein, partial [Burkholderiaceae bacterium]